MEKKIGIIAIMVNDRNQAERINNLLAEFGEIILSRQGLHIESEKVNVISLIVNSDTNTINSLTGKIGRIKDIKVRTLQIN